MNVGIAAGAHTCRSHKVLPARGKITALCAIEQCLFKALR
jgi:hypothetical protein